MNTYRQCWCARRKYEKLLLRLLPALLFVYVTTSLCNELASSNKDFSQRRSQLAEWDIAAVSALESESLSIVSLASARDRSHVPHSATSADVTGHVTSGDVPFNVTSGETRSCWRRLRRRLGRRPRLVVIGDSRARGLYHHLRSSWGLQPHTRHGSECLEHFVYKNRTDWCHYHASSPDVDLRFFWNRLADSGLLQILESLRADCEAGLPACPHLLVLSMGTHQLRVPESTDSRRLLHAVIGLEMTAVSLERLSGFGVQVFWKLSEPENFEMVGELTDRSLNYAHAIYNAILVDRLAQLTPSARFWSSVLPPTENYIARCRLDPAFFSNPFSSPQRNCYDRLHYGELVQDQYRSQLQRHLCPAGGRTRSHAGPAVPSHSSKR